MKNTSIWILSLFFMFGCTAGILQAHKLELNLTPNPPVVVAEAGYSGHNHGLAGADVFIYAPEEAEKAFQTGKTDSSGKFAFLPHKAGDWRVVVDDGAGHRSEKGLTLGEDFFLQKKLLSDLSDSSELSSSPEPQQSQESEELQKPDREEAPQKPEAASSQDKAQIPLLWKALLGVSLLFGASGILYGVKARKQSR